MKLIKAIIRPNKVESLKEAFAKIDIGGMTITEVKGHGRQKGHTAVYRGREYEVTLLPKLQIESLMNSWFGEEGLAGEDDTWWDGKATTARIVGDGS